MHLVSLTPEQKRMLRSRAIPSMRRAIAAMDEMIAEMDAREEAAREAERVARVERDARARWDLRRWFS
jgi:hypothetical protein